jgi:hypothetical protein
LIEQIAMDGIVMFDITKILREPNEEQAEAIFEDTDFVDDDTELTDNDLRDMEVENRFFAWARSKEIGLEHNIHWTFDIWKACGSPTDEGEVTTQEAYAMHQLSNAADAINGVIGQLRCMTEHIPEDQMNDVTRIWQNWMSNLANRLAASMNRIRMDTKTFLGGESRYAQLSTMSVTKRISFRQTFLKGFVADVDGESCSNEP